MNNSEISPGIQKLRDFFLTNETKDVAYRIAALKRLRHTIKKQETAIFDALFEDLNKSDFEAYATEVSLVLHEIDLNIRKLRKWAKPERRRTPLLFFPSKSKIYKEPYGVVLIIAPWNYPFQLMMSPLVAAVGAGNCVALKTSPNAPATALVMEKIVEEVFVTEHVTIFHGNREVNQALLTERFDYIFFTGSPSLGKVVMEAAAKHLTPVTLELGGKSPCIVDEDADLAIAARRIIWGKTINSGQTCIAPDYLMVHSKVKADFVYELKQAILAMFGENPHNSSDYPAIVSSVAMRRLISYLEKGDIIIGGKYEENDYYMEPSVIENLPADAPILNEEIFGPIFPLMEFDAIEEVIDYVKQHEKPLALYFFSNNKKHQQRIIRETSSGGMCINDTIIHVANPKLPFGGVGNSGMGHYHGKYGFETFTHLKSVVTSSFFLDMKVKYPPYEGKLSRFKRFL